MSTEPRTNGTTPEEIEADIARQRDELASTVDALHAKLDVKTRAQGQGRRAARPGHHRRRASRSRRSWPVPRPYVAAIGGFIALRVRRSR